MTLSKTDVVITVDMEQDCPPYMTTYTGVEQGTDKLLELFKSEGVKATFFFTGMVAKKYPKIVQQVILEGHEIGCHGYTHKVFSQMSGTEAIDEIQRSVHELRKFTQVISFRAPNLIFPEKYLSILQSHGFVLDSSLALYKLPYLFKTRNSPIRRIPVSVTSSVLRLPKWIRSSYLSIFNSPIVIFVHPWEFVDLRNEPLRLDCRFKTGDIAVECLKGVIQYFKKENKGFKRIKDAL